LQREVLLLTSERAAAAAGSLDGLPSRIHQLIEPDVSASPGRVATWARPTSSDIGQRFKPISFVTMYAQPDALPKKGLSA
jgi:hypothetical protein